MTISINGCDLTIEEAIHVARNMEEVVLDPKALTAVKKGTGLCG